MLLHRSTRVAMACRWDAALRGDDADHLDAVAAAAFAEVARLDRLLSRFDPASETTRLNRHPGEWLRVDADVAELLTACAAAREQTGGAFDIAAVPGRPAGGWAFDAARRAAFLEPGTRLDFGGCGKGFALDRVEAVLRRFGVAAALVSAGSSSTLAVGGPWAVPLRDGGDAVSLTDRHLSVSAAARAAEPSDLVAPRTGRPAAGPACLAIAATGLRAEVLTTAAVAHAALPPARPGETVRSVTAP